MARAFRRRMKHGSENRGKKKEIRKFEKPGGIQLPVPAVKQYVSGDYFCYVSVRCSVPGRTCMRQRLDR